MTVMALAGAGDNIVSSKNVHGGTFHFFKGLEKQMNIKVHFIDSDDPAKYEESINNQTKMIFIESISNPQYAVPDFDGLANVAHRHGLPLVVSSNPVLTSWKHF